MRVAKQLIVLACLTVFFSTAASAQGPPIHYFHSGNLPPGTVGQGQLLRFANARGYFQPMSFHVPEGVRVSVFDQGQFDKPQEGVRLVGMQVGGVYQLRVTNIPFHTGEEVFPTVEVINRLYPPPGLARRFPVPIHFTQEELELALAGRFVTRVIYLEDQTTAFPAQDRADFQRYFEVGPRQDPLMAADRLGRPMAILRMGSRVPDLDGTDRGLGISQPPLLIYPELDEQTRSGQTSAIERAPRNYPRIPLPAPQIARPPSARGPIVQ